MKKQKNEKTKTLKIVTSVLFVIMFFVGWFSTYCTLIIKQNTEGLANIEVINSGVQRIAKLELENDYDDSLISELYGISRTFVPDSSGNGEIEYFKNSESSLLLVDEFIYEFEIFIDEVYKYREDNDRDNLFEASERNYTVSANIVKNLNSYMLKFSSDSKIIENILLTIVAIIIFLLVIILVETIKELKINKEISKDMFLDSSTGLFNRTKCQEVLKIPVNDKDMKERVIIIFDLNDLKKTNDQLGHREGDALISSFATQLKNATNIFENEVFVGRYGGDEFMAYFESVEEKDVKLYLDELLFLVDKFNNTANKPFKLSFAVGYSITNADTRGMTMREIFDEADAKMYENKIKMKAKKKAELEKQGIVEEEYIDERI